MWYFQNKKIVFKAQRLSVSLFEMPSRIIRSREAALYAKSYQVVKAQIIEIIIITRQPVNMGLNNKHLQSAHSIHMSKVYLWELLVPSMYLCHILFLPIYKFYEGWNKKKLL